MMPRQQPGADRPSASLVIRNRCDRARIDHRFLPLVDAAVSVLTGIFAGVIDIRLQGSVARGEAVIGRSDIDFMALLEAAPSDAELALLQERAEQLRRDHPIISRVDLDAAAAAMLVPFQRFALSSDSISVYGADGLTRRVQRVDRMALARLVTPDAADLVTGYRVLVVEAGTDAATLRFASRVVGKDLLKCLRFLVLQRGGDYEVSIDGIYRQAADYAAELIPLADRLYRLYQTPTADSDLLLDVLDEAEATMLPILEEHH